jgi:hypothetical protein
METEGAAQPQRCGDSAVGGGARQVNYIVSKLLFVFLLFTSSCHRQVNYRFNFIFYLPSFSSRLSIRADPASHVFIRSNPSSPTPNPA